MTTLQAKIFTELLADPDAPDAVIARRSGARRRYVNHMRNNWVFPDLVPVRVKPVDALKIRVPSKINQLMEAEA